MAKKKKCKKRCLIRASAESVNIAGNTHRGGSRDMEGEGLCLVGEAPGREEDQQNQVFVGPTGRVIRAFVDAVVPDVPVRFENAVRCYPGPQKVRSGIEPCRPKLFKALERCNPGRIVALGGTAIESLTGERLSVAQVAGGWCWVDIPNIGSRQVSFTYHPSAVLYNKVLKPYWQLITKRILQHPPPVDWKPHGQVKVIEVRSVKRARRVIKKALASSLVALDTEYNTDSGRFLCVAIAMGPNKAYVFGDEICKRGVVADGIEKLCLAPNVRMAAHNWKFDANVLCDAFDLHHGLFVDPDLPWLDTSSMRKIYDPEQYSKLEIADWMVGMGGHKDEMQELLSRYRKSVGWKYELAYDDYPEVVMRYCGWDAVACFRLVRFYGASLRRERLLPVWNDVMGPIGPALFQMEHNGLRVDIEAMDALDARLTKEKDIELAAINSSAPVRRMIKEGVIAAKKKGEEPSFNPRSTVHKRELLFGEHGLGLRPVGKTATGAASTDKSTIAYYTDGTKKNAVLTHLDQYMRLAHKQSTYVDGYRKRLHHPDVDRWLIMPTYRQDTARTGRLSCQNPNIQNIPNRGRPEDIEIRRMFIPLSDDDVLMEIDYSQVEMRLACDLSGDPAMMHCFTHGIDIHRQTAATVLGVAMEDVDKKQRQAAKPVNFGLIFNMSAKGLKDYAAGDYGVELSDEEALLWRKGFFRKYRVYRSWMLRELAMARKRGCAYVYWLGKPFRRRWLFGLGAQGYGERGHAERQVLNTPIQGGASEYTLRSIIALHRMWLKGELPNVTGLCATIHDSILLSVRSNKKKSTFKKCARVMTTHPTVRVPLEVEAKVGPSLGEMKEIGTFSTGDFK